MNIYILGLKDRFRGLDLQKSMLFFTPNVYVVWGDDAKSSPLNFTKYNKFIQKVVNGRNISLGEYYCSRGHNEIYTQFLNSDAEWALVLEEDVTLISDFAEVTRLQERVKSPAIIHLGGIDQILGLNPNVSFWIEDLVKTSSGAEQESIILNVRGAPFGAYAYLINREAALIAKTGNSKLIQPQLADWPSTWAFKVQFKITKESLFRVNLSRSNLDLDRASFKIETSLVNEHLVKAKLKGWIRLILNCVPIIPLIKRVAGVSIVSELHKNLFMYVFQRLIHRLTRA